MNIVLFLLANWDSVLLVIAAVAGIIILYKKGETELLKKVLFVLITKAEQEYGSGTGELKKAAVVAWVYERLPKILTLFISMKELERLIENVLEYAKSKWQANIALKQLINAQSKSEG